MLRLGAATVAASMLAQGCYAFDSWSGAARTPHYETTREVHVGAALDVQADVTPDAIQIATKATPQCHPAKFGTLVERQSRRGSPSFWAHISWFGFLLAVEAGSIALAADGGNNDMHDTAEFVIGLSSTSVAGGFLLMYLASLVSDNSIITPWFMHEHAYDERSVTVGAASTWTGATHACGSADAAPSVPLEVHVAFAGSTRTILWRTRTDAQGNVSLPVIQTIRAVAHYCGMPHVEISQGEDAGRGIDEGRPDAPRAPLRRARNVFADVGGALDVPLDRIADAWSRQVATECHRAQLDTCVGPEMPKALSDCEEMCASRVDALRCVIGRRACVAKAAGDSEAELCATLYGRCLGEEGVSSDALGTCVQTCQRATAEKACEVESKRR